MFCMLNDGGCGPTPVLPFRARACVGHVLSNVSDSNLVVNNKWNAPSKPETSPNFQFSLMKYFRPVLEYVFVCMCGLGSSPPTHI